MLVLYGSDATAVESAAQSLFVNLTLRVVAVLVVLLVAAGMFRNEIEQDTLTYLSTRSVTRPDIAIGKYLGAVGASLVFLIPAGIVPLLIAGIGGAPPPPTSVPATIVELALFSALSYGALFLFLGLASRSALIIGLLYGFLWEQLLQLLPGSFPKLTLQYYFFSFAGYEVASGPLSDLHPSVPLSVTIAAPVVVAVFFAALTAVLFRSVETAPQRTSA